MSVEEINFEEVRLARIKLATMLPPGTETSYSIPQGPHLVPDKNTPRMVQSEAESAALTYEFEYWKVYFDAHPEELPKEGDDDYVD